jgi:ABC-2 type transport system permease protein
MFMKKSSITGWQDVFTFTLRQTLKNKAYLVTLILMLVIAAASMPIISYIKGGDEDSKEPNPIQKVYVYNNTSLPGMDYNGLIKDERLSHIIFEPCQVEYDVITDRIENEEQTSVVLTLSEENGAYSLSFLKASKGPVKVKNLSQLIDAVSKQFDAFKLEALGVSEQQAELLHKEVSSEVFLADVNGEIIIKESTAISQIEYWFIYGLLFFIMMVTTISGPQVATSIVTEKSTRVVEYLLMSVRPLALMIGKVLAMVSAAVIQMVGMVLMLFASDKLSAALISGKSVIAQYVPDNMFQNLNLVNILLCFVMVILGVIFYATLAGLAGATVSKLEQVTEGLSLFTMTTMVGVYVGLAAATAMKASSDSSFVTFALLFPLSSPFVMPGAILVGKASLVMAGITIVLQLLLIILLFLFIARIYETLILHNGEKIKVKDLVKLFRTV